MTATDVENRKPQVEPLHRSHETEHPPDRSYVWLAVILGLITAAEIWTYFWDDDMSIGPFSGTSLLVVTLFPMMIAKFIIVAGWFMHLRYDNPMFRRVFVLGTLAAVVLYCAFLTAMQFFSSRWTSEEERLPAGSPVEILDPRGAEPDDFGDLGGTEDTDAPGVSDGDDLDDGADM